MAIVAVGGIREREGVLEPPSAGHGQHAFLTETTFGPRFGEAVALGPGTGFCKSTLLIREMASDLGAGNPVGDFLLEESPAETTARVWHRSSIRRNYCKYPVKSIGVTRRRVSGRAAANPNLLLSQSGQPSQFGSLNRVALSDEFIKSACPERAMVLALIEIVRRSSS